MAEREREGIDTGRLVIRWMINAAAIWAAFRLVPGITPTDRSLEAITIIALIFGLVNAIIRPILTFLTCPLIILTLGLGTLVVNTILFWLAGVIGQWLGFGYTVADCWSAFFGALVVSIVSVILSAVLGERRRRHID